MINIDFSNGVVEDFTIVVSDRMLQHKGQLSNIQKFVYKGNLNSANEISFEIYKEVDGKEEHLWNEVYDFGLVWIKEVNEYFEIYVSMSETNNLVKKVTGTSLCEAELSQTILRNIEINTEDDIARDDYVITKFYDDSNHQGSLLHRILEKVPHYTVRHVDNSLKLLQRAFSIDNVSIYDFLTGECAEQFNCLFKFDSVERTISVYDLLTVCQNPECGHRGEFNDICPKCGSTNLSYYGNDTTIFVSADNLTNEILYDTDTGRVKNCFRLEAGDDDMTAAAIACNPNGSAYIYYFSDEQKHDMPYELVQKMEEYDSWVESKTDEYVGLSKQLYDCIDKILYLQSSKMPNIEIPKDTIDTEVAKLNSLNGSSFALTYLSAPVNGSGGTTVMTVNSALVNYTRSIVNTGVVKVEVDTDPSSGNSFTYVGQHAQGYLYGTWTGRFKVTSYSDDNIVKYSNPLSMTITNDYHTFLTQRIMTSISNDNDDENCVYNVLSINDLNYFKEALKEYSYNRLKSFADAIQGVIDILIEQNQASADSSDSNSSNTSTYYDEFYVPYYNKLKACQEEMNIRSEEIKAQEKLQSKIIKARNIIQEELDFEKYLGDLYPVFCSYRREDTYKNENFISDGLNNAEILTRAQEFVNLAKQEIVKSGEHQHSLSSNLHNFLIMDEFAPIVNSFELGNWLRFKFDNSIYRLRLTSYQMNGSDLSSINTEFSDMTKTANGVNDVKSILDDAKSMASSYSSVSKQATSGESVSLEFEQMKQHGLNSALINIKNNQNEEVTYDKHGILCKSYNDIEDKYDDKQLKITHNILAFTNNNWASCSLALGEHDYYYFNADEELTPATGYGLTADFVTAGIVNNSQMIGGNIYSTNYSPTDKTGSHIGLLDGKFVFYGSNGHSLSLDDNGLTMKGKFHATEGGTIGGFTIGAEAIYNGKSTFTSANDGVYLGINGISLGANNSFAVGKDGKLTCVDATATNLNIKTGYVGGIDGFTVKSQKMYTNGKSYFNNSETNSLNGIYIGTAGIALGANNPFKVTDEGVMSAKSGEIGDFTIKDGKLYNGKTSLKDTTNDGVFISKDGIALGKGKFIITSAGAVTAKSGTIGGATISSNSIKSDNGNWAIYSDGSATFKDVTEINTTEITTGNFTASDSFKLTDKSDGTAGAKTQFDTLVANKITATEINAEKITTGTLSFDRLQSYNNASAEWVHYTFVYDVNFDTKTVSRMTMHYLGQRPTVVNSTS